jgi:hypothetical protein
MQRPVVVLLRADAMLLDLQRARQSGKDKIHDYSGPFKAVLEQPNVCLELNYILQAFALTWVLN